MVIFIANMELPYSHLEILEDQSNVPDLTFVFNEPSLHEILRGKVLQIFESPQIDIASLVNQLLFGIGCRFDFHLVLEDVESVGRIVACIHEVFLVFLNVAFVIAHKKGTWAA